MLFSYYIRVSECIHSCLNVNKLLPRKRRGIWSSSDYKGTRTDNHLGCKRTLNHLAKLAKWLSVRLQTKWLWIRVPLQSHKETN